jgi:CheY-like chemotaxis protein
MSKKLLIVDDQAGITRVVGLIVKQLGMEFRAVNSPLKATEEFINYQPDILILDMIMPEKDGIEVLNEILLTGIPAKIVLTSGYSEAYLRLAEGVAKFYDSGTVSVLKKPFRRAELVRLLSDLCADNGNQPTEAPATAGPAE